MSLDGVSPKSITSSLRLAATNVKPAVSDSAHRRPASDDKRGARGQQTAEANRPTEQLQQAPRRFPRYVPAANVAQLLLDIVLIAAT